MLSKEKFALLMTKWELVEKELLWKDDMFHKICGGCLLEVIEGLESLLCETMIAAMNDANEWIPYFVYEREFNLSEPCVYDGEDCQTVIPTETWVDVYNLIVDGTGEELSEEEIDNDDESENEEGELNDG